MAGRRPSDGKTFLDRLSLFSPKVIIQYYLFTPPIQTRTSRPGLLPTDLITLPHETPLTLPRPNNLSLILLLSRPLLQRVQPHTLQGALMRRLKFDLRHLTNPLIRSALPRRSFEAISLTWPYTGFSQIGTVRGGEV